jgi:hypothetical protein
MVSRRGMSAAVESRKLLCEHRSLEPNEPVLAEHAAKPPSRRGDERLDLDERAEPGEVGGVVRQEPAQAVGLHRGQSPARTARRSYAGRFYAFSGRRPEKWPLRGSSL